MQYVFDDGGRAEAGYKGQMRDCTCRAISIAAQMPYQAAYDILNALGAAEGNNRWSGTKSSARTGVRKPTIRRYLLSLGWTWVPTMQIGKGCRVHLRADELPGGRLIVAVSKHMVAVIDGVIHDTHNCSRNGKRCVYGYFTRTP